MLGLFSPRKPLMRFIICSMTAILFSAFFSCGDDKEELAPTPQPPVQEDDVPGSVVFSVSAKGGKGEGTSTSPVVVQRGDTLHMTLSQTSSYNDPDGTVFTCKPEAAIKLFTAADTLFVKDFKTLTAVQENPELTDEISSGERLTKKTLQSFSVGGKEIFFDLAYDIFNHVNSRQKRIEMPYIKVNSANYGTAQAEETRAVTPVAVTGMRITPHAPQTRGTIVDSTAYDVSVSFNIALESVNTKEVQKDTLSFEVVFLAVVESTTDYPDPVMQFDYQLQVLGGTGCIQSPFLLAPHQTLSICFQGNARYDYFSVAELVSKTMRFEPKASVMLTANTEDTLWVTNKEELEQFVAADAIIDDDGAFTTGQKTFSVAGKDIVLNWNYETYATINVEGKDVAVPCFELGEPEIVSVDATELPNVTIPGKQAKVYEVEVRFSQELRSVNLAQESSETIEYIVKFIGATEVKLVKVVYRKDWEWVEPHDNIMLAYYPIVYRDRIYSNGETFTDTFRDAGHVAFIISAVQPEIALYGGEREENGITFFYGIHSHTNIADSVITTSGSVAVPNLSLVKRGLNLVTGEEVDIDYLTSPAGTWDEYVTGKNYANLDIPLNGIDVVGADSVSSKPSGWYFFAPTYMHTRFYEYDERVALIDMDIYVCVYDQFLVIDGQMINFLEFRKPATFNFKEKNITMPNGAPGIVATYDAHLQFLGRNFYGAITDTIYQQTPTAPSIARSAPKQHVQQRSNSWQKSSTHHNSNLVKLPPPYKNFSSFEYGGDPFGEKRK